MLRIALVNAGVGYENYALALARLRDVSCVAVVDRDQSTTDFCVRTGAAHFSSLAEVFQRQIGLDAVIVNGPGSICLELALQSAASGKHVLATWPIAPTILETQRLIDACQRLGVQLMVSQPLRFIPFQQTAKAVRDSGKIGELGLLRLHHWTGAVSSTSLGTDILDRVGREVDIACWLFDAYPETVYATEVSEPEQASGIQIHFGFVDGGMALVGRLYSPSVGSDGYYTLTLIGSTGAVYADEHRNVNLLLREVAQGVKVGQGAEYLALELQEFADAIQQKRSPSVTGMDAIRAIGVTAAVVESLESRRVTARVGDRYELR